MAVNPELTRREAAAVQRAHEFMGNALITEAICDPYDGRIVCLQCLREDGTRFSIVPGDDALRLKESTS